MKKIYTNYYIYYTIHIVQMQRTRSLGFCAKEMNIALNIPAVKNKKEVKQFLELSLRFHQVSDIMRDVLVSETTKKTLSRKSF
jgi:hypothetical protein